MPRYNLLVLEALLCASRFIAWMLSYLHLDLVADNVVIQLAHVLFWEVGAIIDASVVPQEVLQAIREITLASHLWSNRFL